MAEFNGVCYRIVNVDRACEVAAQVEFAARGAAGRNRFLRQESQEAKAVWLAPCEAVHTFGMTRPIDVVFLDRKKRARKLVRNLAPSRISMCLAGDSVLKLTSGAIERSGLQRGDRLRLETILKAA